MRKHAQQRMCMLSIGTPRASVIEVFQYVPVRIIHKSKQNSSATFCTLAFGKTQPAILYFNVFYKTPAGVTASTIYSTNLKYEHV